MKRVAIFIPIIFMLFLFLMGIPFLDIVELKTRDLRFISRGDRKASDVIALAVVDEKSLDKEGRWPWPRTKFARLIDYLSGDGAKVIGFDVFFPEPSEYDIDLTLANAIKSSKAKVILGYNFHMSQKSLGYEIGSETINDKILQIRGSRYLKIYLRNKKVSYLKFFIKAYSPEVNIPILDWVADASGYCNTPLDSDGSVRQMFLIIKCGQGIFPPLSVQSVWHYLDKPRLTVKVASYGVEGIQMGNITIPTKENGLMLINYLGPPKTFPHYSITDIINNKLPKGTFKDKIVLVGCTAIGTSDVRNTPFSPVYPGVEIHATVIDNILRQQFLTIPALTTIYDLLAIVLLGIITGIVLSLTRVKVGLFASSLIFIGYIILCQYLFSKMGIILNLIYPLLTVILVYICDSTYRRFLVEKGEKQDLTVD